MTNSPTQMQQLHEDNARQRKLLKVITFVAAHHVDAGDLADALDSPTHSDIVAAILAEAAGVRPMSTTTVLELIAALRREPTVINDPFEGLD